MPKKTLLQEGAEIVCYYRDAMGMQDWTVDLFIQDDPPAWSESVGPSVVGECDANVRTKTGWIWISPARCKRLDEPFQIALFHELSHMELADLDVNDNNEKWEFNNQQHAKVLYKAYLYDKGRGWKPA